MMRSTGRLGEGYLLPSAKSFATARAWLILALIAAVALGALLPTFVGILPTLGRNIPQAHIERDYLMALGWATLLGFSIALWPVERSDRRALVIVWLAKVVVTLGLMLVYEWHYGLDAYVYYERSLLPEFPTEQNPLRAGTGFVAQVAWLHARLLPDSYHMLKVTFALFGLIAVYLIYRGAVLYSGRSDRRILYTIALFPSVLFWSSIIGKDPLQLLGIALYFHGVLGWRVTGRSRHVVTIAAGVALSFAIRLWSAPILLFPLLVFVMFGLRSPWRRVAFTVLAVAAFAWSLGEFATRFQIAELQDLQTAAEARGYGWGGSSAQEQTEFTSVGAMVRFAPVGAFTALFRPLPGEVRNMFGLVAGVENLFLLGLALIAIARLRLKAFRDPVLTWATLLVLTWSLVYGFVSIYNFGAAVRFKLQILPIMLLVLSHLAFGRARVPNVAPGLRQRHSAP